MTTHPITESALVRRINRKLAPAWQRVCKLSERHRGYGSLGRYHMMDTFQNTVIDTHLDLDHLGQQLGVIDHAEAAANR